MTISQGMTQMGDLQRQPIFAILHPFIPYPVHQMSSMHQKGWTDILAQTGGEYINARLSSERSHTQEQMSFGKHCTCEWEQRAKRWGAWGQGWRLESEDYCLAEVQWLEKWHDSRDSEFTWKLRMSPVKRNSIIFKNWKGISSMCGAWSARPNLAK